MWDVELEGDGRLWREEREERRVVKMRRRAARRVGIRARPKKRRVVVMVGQVMAPEYVCMIGRWSVS